MLQRRKVCCWGTTTTTIDTRKATLLLLCGFVSLYYDRNVTSLEITIMKRFGRLMGTTSKRQQQQQHSSRHGQQGRPSSSSSSSSSLPHGSGAEPSPCSFDVFLIHTGAQKRMAVDTLGYILQSYDDDDDGDEGHFRCFLDMEMNHSDGAPSKQVEEALETCRFAVAVISKDFLERNHPQKELRYTFERMRWIRKHFGWESLWVIMYNFEISEYDDVRLALDLPQIGKDIVLYEWLDNGVAGRYSRWSELCCELANSMKRHDRVQGAKAG